VLVGDQDALLLLEGGELVSACVTWLRIPPSCSSNHFEASRTGWFAQLEHHVEVSLGEAVGDLRRGLRRLGRDTRS
jgi:hypothetical protein